MDVSNLDIGVTLTTGDDSAMLQHSYERAARLGMLTSPGSLIMDAGETHAQGIIDGEYGPAGFMAAFEAIEQKQRTPAI